MGLSFALSFDYAWAVGVGLFLGVIMLRPLGRWLLGPLFALEIVRLARRGDIILIRVGYALALLFALYAAFPTESALGRRAMSNFADRFAHLFLIIQSVAVMLIAPVYMAGAVSAEKENRSLDFL